MTVDRIAENLNWLLKRGLPEAVERPGATLRSAPYPDGRNFGYKATATDGTDLGWVRVDSGHIKNGLFTVIDFERENYRYGIRQFPTLGEAADHISDALAPELSAGRKVVTPPKQVPVPPQGTGAKFANADGLARAATKALLGAGVTGWTAVVNLKGEGDPFDDSTDDEVSFVDAAGFIHPVSIQSGPYGHLINRTVFDDIGEVKGWTREAEITPRKFPAEKFAALIVEHAPKASAATENPSPEETPPAGPRLG